MKLSRIKLPVLLLSLLVVYSCRTAGTVPAEEAADAWYNLGNAYTELGRHDDAVKAFLKAQKLNPELMSAGFNLARVQILQKKYDDSINQLDNLLRVDPGNRLILETKAWAFHLKGDDAAALEIYNQVLDVFSDSRNSLYNSALILVELKKNERALKRFTRLVEVYEDEISSVFEIAKLNAVMGNSSEALLWLEKYLALYPDDYAALELAGDMYAAEKQFAEAVTEYRFILDSDSDVDLMTPDLLGRVNLKAAEILLIFMEDLNGGLSALRESVDYGWKDQDVYDRLLSYENAGWFDDVRELLDLDEESPEADESATGDESL